MSKIIYLDNAATTRVSKIVVREMIPYLTEKYGNSSSTHALGIESRKALEESKKTLARVINCKPYEIIFTSGGTESNNMVLFGVEKKENRNKIIISKIEHSSIYKSAMELKKQGYNVVEISVNDKGLIDLEQLKQNIDDKTALVSIAHVNSEIGSVQELSKIGDICRQKRVLFHTDALQSYGKLPIDVKKMNISFLSAAAHKIGGPKGIGFLYIREGVEINPIIYGGSQEKGVRAGTENVAGAVGFASALSEKHFPEKTRRMRDYFVKEIEKIGGKLNGAKENVIYTHAHISFSEYDGSAIVSFLSQKGIMCSTGSACDSKNEDKRVLLAIGLNEKEITGAVRFTFSPEISKKDVDFVVKEIKLFMNIYKN